MAIVTIENIEIVVRTRGEHCLPHVHADCSPEGWGARYRFSFISDDVEFWDYQPGHPKRPPAKATLNALGQAVYNNLAAVRERWGQAMGTVCLDNTLIDVSDLNPGVLAKSSRQTRGLLRIRQATYNLETRVVTMIMSGGSAYNKSLQGR